MVYGWNQKVTDIKKQCKECYGYGWHLREYTLSDDTFKVTCDGCNGTGRTKRRSRND